MRFYLPVVFLWISTVLCVLANPVDYSFRGPAIFATSYSYVLIAIVCIAIEVSLLRIIARAVHRIDCDISMTISLAVANVLSLALILLPIYRFTGSVILSEIAVVSAEAWVIQKVFTQGGGYTDFNKALIYSSILNLITYLIGFVSQ